MRRSGSDGPLQHVLTPPAKTRLSEHPAALALAGLLALAVAIGIGRFVYTPILPHMVAGLGLGRSEAGLIASSNLLGYLVGALLAAWRCLPGNQNRWLLGVLAVSGLSTGAMALTTSLGAFLLLRFLNGAAGSLAMVLASSLVMDRLAAAGRHGWAAAIYVGIGTGIVISALAVPAVASGGADWRGPWLFSGALSLALLVPVGLLLQAPRALSPPPPDRMPGQEQGLGRLILAYGLFGFGYMVTAAFVADMVRTDPLLRSAEHLVWLCVGLAAAPSVALWSWAGRRWGNEQAFAIACLIEAGAIALTELGSHVWLLLTAAGLFGGTFVGVTALGLIHARHLAGVDAHRVMAWMIVSLGLGQMVAPTLAGVLRDVSGSYLAPSLLAAAALVAAATLAINRLWSPDSS